MIKAVIFDLDGTILNRDDSLIAFANQQYNRFHKELGHVPKNVYISRFRELDNRGYVWKDKVYQQLTKEFLITGLTWEYLLNDYLIHFQNSCIPFSNLLNMLDELKREKVLLGIITNGKCKFQMNNIKALGIESYFETILISECEGIKKPNHEIFQKALHKLDVLASESVFVGDHPINDIKAAQDVGMNAIWKRDEEWKNVKTDFTINNLIEIPLILKSL